MSSEHNKCLSGITASEVVESRTPLGSSKILLLRPLVGALFRRVKFKIECEVAFVIEFASVWFDLKRW